jgi:sterol desaturase/sphingolipid hydroxylase (fatty acid hydroxylase superfamily)
MIAPRTSFNASSQIVSLRFWPYYLAVIVACSFAGKAAFLHWNLTPLIKIDGESVYKASHLGLLNYIVWPIVSLLFLDLFHYWKHRAQHRFFWKYHAVHHSIENLSAVNSYHHWTDPIFSVAMVAIPMALLIGMDTPAFFVVSTLISLQGPFIHSNTRFNLGIFNRVIADNRFHRIHHSVEGRHFHKNFGERSTIWDQIFGTAHFPGPLEWPGTGLVGLSEPKLTTDYLWRPFRK